MPNHKIVRREQINVPLLEKGVTALGGRGILLPRRD